LLCTRGFPAAVEAAILKGAPKLLTRAGLSLPPADFNLNIQKLTQEFGVQITPEQGMSYLMYPKVKAWKFNGMFLVDGFDTV
jgi:pyruvate carboxylase